ncbi:hypothetical protein AVEN_119288-1 [Araneus ventricosus]|uniref:Uncharacterized protein n=1 Tax=Araneus ventricosus TaxID=182803 RepID=A0A4Y2EFA2_ARAVE|nr:hypothetical protein AVEN_119288-1 [Araneus ventricosus]
MALLELTAIISERRACEVCATEFDVDGTLMATLNLIESWTRSRSLASVHRESEKLISPMRTQTRQLGVNCPNHKAIILSRFLRTDFYQLELGTCINWGIIKPNDDSIAN